MSVLHLKHYASYKFWGLKEVQTVLFGTAADYITKWEDTTISNCCSK
jgi:hypothetical protein